MVRVMVKTLLERYMTHPKGKSCGGRFAPADQMLSAECLECALGATLGAT